MMEANGQSVGALRVALLEDDALLRDRVLCPGLANFGFDVHSMETASELRVLLATTAIDIVVLDVGLPDTDGFSVARDVRAAHPGMGVVMLTGRGETRDRVRGLSEGADAYLAKPVEMELLAATLHSLARRLHGRSSGPAPKIWQLGSNDWCLVSPRGREIALTRAERQVVRRLMATPGEVVTRVELIATLTDNIYDFDTHRLESLVYRLRRKVTDTCGESLPLAAAHGAGYVINSRS